MFVLVVVTTIAIMTISKEAIVIIEFRVIVVTIIRITMIQ